MLLYCVAASAARAQATSLVRRQNLISKSHSRALPRRFNSRSPIQLTIILDGSDPPYTGDFDLNFLRCRNGRRSAGVCYPRVVDLSVCIQRSYSRGSTWERMLWRWLLRSIIPAERPDRI